MQPEVSHGLRHALLLPARLYPIRMSEVEVDRSPYPPPPRYHSIVRFNPSSNPTRAFHPSSRCATDVSRQRRNMAHPMVVDINGGTGNQRAIRRNVAAPIADGVAEWP